jgi:hypothetical protein
LFEFSFTRSFPFSFLRVSLNFDLGSVSQEEKYFLQVEIGTCYIYAVDFTSFFSCWFADFCGGFPDVCIL